MAYREVPRIPAPMFEEDLIPRDESSETSSFFSTPGSSSTSAPSASTRQILGPFTNTSWAPSQTCLTPMATCLSCGNGGWYAQYCDSGDINDEQACWPPRTKGVTTTSVDVGGWGVYSPGTGCPSGYIAIASKTEGGTSNFDFEFTLEAGETAIGCCPEGFIAYSEDYGQLCTSVASSDTLTVGICRATEVVYTDLSLPLTISKEDVDFAITAPMFQMVWRSQDIATPSATNATETSPTETSKPSSGLSSGAKAGIGIGVALGVILFAVAALLLWRARRRKMRAVPPEDYSNHELPGTQQPKYTSELYDGGHTHFTSELDASQGHAELGSEIKPAPSPLIDLNPSHPIELDSGPR